MEFDFTESTKEAKRAISVLETGEARAFLQTCLEQIVTCFEEGGKLLIAGNGGSLCDAMHFAEELTGFYREKREALPAMALSDPGHMSCVANDVGFSHVFARQVEALGKREDRLIVLSTSGNSENLIHAAKAAHRKKIKVIGFLGKGGGELKSYCDLVFSVDGFRFSDRIQEVHMTAIHMLIEAVESVYLTTSALT